MIAGHVAKIDPEAYARDGVSGFMNGDCHSLHVFSLGNFVTGVVSRFEVFIYRGPARQTEPNRPARKPQSISVASRTSGWTANLAVEGITNRPRNARKQVPTTGFLLFPSKEGRPARN
jgi:hypothetical protein